LLPKFLEAFAHLFVDDTIFDLPQGRS